MYTDFLNSLKNKVHGDVAEKVEDIFKESVEKQKIRIQIMKQPLLNTENAEEDKKKKKHSKRGELIKSESSEDEEPSHKAPKGKMRWKKVKDAVRKPSTGAVGQILEISPLSSIPTEEHAQQAPTAEFQQSSTEAELPKVQESTQLEFVIEIPGAIASEEPNPGTLLEPTIPSQLKESEKVEHIEPTNEQPSIIKKPRKLASVPVVKPRKFLKTKPKPKTVVTPEKLLDMHKTKNYEVSQGSDDYADKLSEIRNRVNQRHINQ